MFKQLTVIIFLAYSLIFAPATSAQDLYPSSKHILENGMPVIVTEMRGNPMVSVYCLVKTGAATEGEFLGSGISHFLEHMLFKTTEKYAAGEIAKAIQALGGAVNASTSLDFTIYTLTVPADKFSEALDILVDMLTAATFDPEEVEKEREVILREMNMVNDRPRRKISRLAFQNVFHNHPYKHPTIGYKDLFEQISRDDLVAYYQTRYIPNNMVFSVAGDVRAVDVVGQVEEAFKEIKRRPYPQRILEGEPDQVSSRYLEEEFEVPHTYMSLAYQGVRLMDHDLYALDVLAHILGQGKTARLYRDLYMDRGLVYSVTAYNFTPVDKGAFEIEVQLEEEHLDKVKALILGQIQAIQAKGIRKKELDTAKEKVRADYIFERQHTSSIAWSQALDEAFTGDYKFSQQYVDGVAKVTVEDIRRVAGAYLQEQALSVSVLKPKKEKEKLQATDAEEKAISAEKFILDNGLTLILQEDRRFPMVSLRLGVVAGARQEDNSLMGVSSVMSALWMKGTKRRTWEEINAFVASRAMQVGPSSGRNSMGISMDFLPMYLDDALDLLAELVHQPTFPEEHLDQIIDNMIQGLKARDTNPFATTKHQLRQILFPTHPYGRDSSGTEETLNALTQKDCVQFYGDFMDPSHMVISVIGDYDASELKKRLEKDYASLTSTPVELKTFSEEPLTEPRSIEKFLDKEQAVVMFGFHGPTLYHPDHEKAEVAAAILGSSFSGRMFANIRDKLSKAYTLGGGYVPGLDAGHFTFYISTTDENVDTVIDLLKKEILDLQTTPLPDKELKDMKTYLKGMHKSGMQTHHQVNLTIHYDELYGLGYDKYKSYDENIDRITKEDIQYVAQTYWDLDKVAIAVTRPEPKEEEASAEH